MTYSPITYRHKTTRQKGQKSKRASVAMSRQFEVKGVLSLLSCCLAGSKVLASVPTSSAVTAFDSQSCTSPVYIKGTPGGYQVEGEFGVASSLVWLES